MLIAATAYFKLWNSYEGDVRPNTTKRKVLNAKILHPKRQHYFHKSRVLDQTSSAVLKDKVSAKIIKCLCCNAQKFPLFSYGTRNYL